VLAAAKLGEELAARAGLPAFVGAILAGLLLGQAGVGLVSPKDLEKLGLVLSLGINFTLFLAGVEELTNPRLFRPSSREALAAATLLSVSAVGVVLYVTLAKGVGAEAAVAYALAVSMVSLGPLMKLLSERGLGERELALLRVGLMVELSAIVLFNSVFRGFNVYLLVETAAVAVAILLFGRTLLSRTLYRVERYVAAREAPFALIVALVIMTGYIAEALGFNAAVTALLLGVFASDYLIRRPAYLERIRAFTFGFLEPLFFAGVGLYAVLPGLQELVDSMVLLSLLLASRAASSAIIGVKGREQLALMAKGGIDAAMLLSLLHLDLIGAELYTAGVTSLVAATIISAFHVKGLKPAVELWRVRIADLPLDHSVVYYREPAIHAARIVAKKSAAVVIDEDYKPIGYVVAEDLVEVDPRVLERIPTFIFSRPEVPVVSKDELVAEVLSDPAMVHEPIIAVVNDDGTLIGTITPRDLLEQIMSAPVVRGGSGSGRDRHSS
jgi:Kef-type K+ transport system membrane component KefB